MSNVIICNDDNLKEEINEGLVLVDFMATWCGPCQKLSVTLDELADDLNGAAKIVKVDIDLSPESTKTYDVRGIPALFVLKQGKIVERLMGVKSKEVLAGLLAKHGS
ncbi:thioredoxin family protein [Pseudoalteromonas umbrosa]|uniref:thioredoxin family protein n=1 Tax=Pseudoalteromonas umbrosa TaxID=3048489 RepID=UPI0024C212C5|nr:thioredoxin domain-containing protein [Pseudoalteromonas sp. B95]MDK1290129.1 thioredoxin domain-containing protein [Pseudoalteromonas sp. B95]